MSPEYMVLFKLSAAFLALFAIAEFMLHVFRLKAEYTRKIVHIGTGILTLLFPLYLDSVWQVVVICGAFFVLLLLSRRFRLLHSINGIERKSEGSLLYPVIVILVFFFYKYQEGRTTIFNNHLYFYLPMLLLAICDPVAALTGSGMQNKKNLPAGKTWYGTAAFFVTAAIVSSALLVVYNISSVSATFVFTAASTIAVATALAEKWSKGGWDNFTIPLVAMLCLIFLENLAL